MGHSELQRGILQLSYVLWWYALEKGIYSCATALPVLLALIHVIFAEQEPTKF